MRTMQKAVARLALATAALTACGSAAAADYSNRFLFVENACPSCPSSYGISNTVGLLSDNLLVTGKNTVSGKSPSGQAMLWDASQPGAVTVKWREPGTYQMPDGSYVSYHPGGPFMGGRIADINASGAFLDGQHLEPNGGLIDGSIMFPTALNDKGLVVGGGNNYGGDGQGHWTDINTGASGSFQIQGATATRPVEVNDSGLVVGYSTVNGQDQAFVFDQRTGSGQLVFDPSVVRSSSFSDVNNNGMALGYRTMLDGTSVAFLYNGLNGQITDLHVATPSVGHLNDLGQIVMGSQFFDGTQWLDLNAITGFGTGVTGYDVNNHGDILLGRGSLGSRDFYITSAVPELSSMALMVLGMLGLGVGVISRRTKA